MIPNLFSFHYVAKKFTNLLYRNIGFCPVAAGFLIVYDPTHRSELRPNSFAEKRDGHSLWNVRVFTQMGSVVAVIMYPSPALYLGEVLVLPPLPPPPSPCSD